MFTWDEITAIRAAIRDWEKRPILAGPRPDGQLGQIVEVMLGTSARIGEVLAIRVADLDLEAPVPMVRIAGTIISRKGEPTHRQDHPKTARSVRRVALRGFALRAARARVRGLRFAGPEALLFPTRVGTPDTTNNVRRQLRDVMDQAGIEDVTPHRFRRTAATAINDVGGRTPARLRAPRPQRPRDHPRALHPPQRDREPRHRRLPREGLRESELTDREEPPAVDAEPVIGVSRVGDLPLHESFAPPHKGGRLCLVTSKLRLVRAGSAIASSIR